MEMLRVYSQAVSASFVAAFCSTCPVLLVCLLRRRIFARVNPPVCVAEDRYGLCWLVAAPLDLDADQFRGAVVHHDLARVVKPQGSACHRAVRRRPVNLDTRHSAIRFDHQQSAVIALVTAGQSGHEMRVKRLERLRAGRSAAEENLRKRIGQPPYREIIAIAQDDQECVLIR